MNLHLKFRSYRLDFSLAKRMPVLGANSNLADGMHILMWDFDNVSAEAVHEALWAQHHRWGLSKIHVLQSSVPGNYHAYCFTRTPWPKVLYILAGTEGIDKQFFKLGVMRGYMTLRFSDKPPTKISHVWTIPSGIAEDVGMNEIVSFEKYWTKIRHHG